MGNRSIRTEYGHGAGTQHGRRMTRADAKAYAKSKRRRQDREAERRAAKE